MGGVKLQMSLGNILNAIQDFLLNLPKLFLKCKTVLLISLTLPQKMTTFEILQNYVTLLGIYIFITQIV